MTDYRVIDAQQLEEELTTVADSIRKKTGGTEPLVWPEDFISGSQKVWDAAYDQFWNQHQ